MEYLLSIYLQLCAVPFIHNQTKEQRIEVCEILLEKLKEEATNYNSEKSE